MIRYSQRRKRRISLAIAMLSAAAAIVCLILMLQNDVERENEPSSSGPRSLEAGTLKDPRSPIRPTDDPLKATRRQQSPELSVNSPISPDQFRNTILAPPEAPQLTRNRPPGAEQLGDERRNPGPLVPEPRVSPPNNASPTAPPTAPPLPEQPDE